MKLSNSNPKSPSNLFSTIALALTVSITLTSNVLANNRLARSTYIESDALPKSIGQQFQTFSRQLDPNLQLHKLAPSNNNVTCNDGSQLGYYKRLNNHSKSWIIYLQGGGFCGSEESCQLRWQRSAHLMSSNFWPKTKQVDGILSSELKENPYLWNANHIYIPYCSSDSWSGLSSDESTKGSSFKFMGSKILEEVIESLYEDLPRESSLYGAKFILLAGDSAGATGVILNLDRINKIVEQKADSIRLNCSQTANCDQSKAQLAPILRGLADSGWFLDNEPYEPFASSQTTDPSSPMDQNGELNCERSRCTPLQSIRQAMRFWNGQVPEACRANYAQEPWRCYFGYRAYQTLKTPLFVVQWLYDEAQLMFDNIVRPDTNGQWNYVNRMVNDLRLSLENVTALFAPSCFSHSLVTRAHWNQISINGFKLPQLLNSWEEQSLLDIAPPTTSPQINPTLLNSMAIIEPQSQQEKPQATNFQQHELTVLPIEDAYANTNNQRSPLSFIQTRGALNELPIRQQQQQPQQQQQQQPQPKSTAINTSRPKSRKRKRNNQLQRNKQTRQRANAEAASSPLSSELPLPINPPTQTSRDLNEVSSSSPIMSPDYLNSPLISIDPSSILYARETYVNNGRLGRSTIVDDTTLMLNNNNVPDEGSMQDKQDAFKWLWPISLRSHLMAGTNKYVQTADRFKLIDSCSWPQCNRDCPASDSDYSFGTIISSFR